jgi:DNA-binding IclR family transcriptional regulator
MPPVEGRRRGDETFQVEKDVLHMAKLPAPDAPPQAKRIVGSAVNVCRILDCFSAETPALNLTSIARAIGLRPSGAHRLLQTLVIHEYLAFDPKRRLYRLGGRVARLVSAYAEATLGEIARPYLERLRDATGETAAVQVRHGDVRYCVVEVSSEQPIALRITETARYPLRRGAAGTVLRAFAPDWRDEHDRQALERVRAAGYSISRGALFPGSIAIYVPLHAASGALVATIGVHGLAFRMPDRSLPAIVEQLQQTSAELGPLLRAEIPLR